MGANLNFREIRCKNIKTVRTKSQSNCKLTKVTLKRRYVINSYLLFCLDSRFRLTSDHCVSIMSVCTGNSRYLEFLKSKHKFLKTP